MAKRIVICADGTWNKPEKDPKKDFPTNVLKLARAIYRIKKKFYRKIDHGKSDVLIHESVKDR